MSTNFDPVLLFFMLPCFVSVTYYSKLPPLFLDASFPFKCCSILLILFSRPYLLPVFLELFFFFFFQVLELLQYTQRSILVYTGYLKRSKIYDIVFSICPIRSGICSASQQCSFQELKHKQNQDKREKKTQGLQYKMIRKQYFTLVLCFLNPLMGWDLHTCPICFSPIYLHSPSGQMITIYSSLLMPSTAFLVSVPFSYCGLILWNHIPVLITMSPPLTVFKSR